MPSSIVINGTTGISNASWTTATRPAAPVAGQQGYNTDIGALETYTGSTWSTSDLPAPSTAGNVLTSTGSAWTSSTPASPAGGSTTTSSAVDITLTSSSNKVQNISMTAADKSVILPAATTITTLGANIFILVNNGSFPYAVKVSGGNAIAVVPVAGTVTLSLTDNSTAAGKWSGTVNSFVPGFGSTGATAGSSYGMGGNFAVTQSYPPVTVTSSTLNSAVPIDNNASTYPSQGYNYGMACNISATTALVVYQVSTTTYAVVITLSGGTLTVGTPVAVLTATTPSQVSAVVLSSTAAFVFADRSSSPSGPLCIPLVMSGATITVGTSISALGGSTVTTISTCAMSSTIALYYVIDGTTTAYLKTLTHNGASAPTVGTNSIAITQFAQGGLCKLTSTTALIAYSVNPSSVLACRVVTISGSSAPTLGTVLSPTATASNASYPLNCYANSATEAVIKYNATERGGAVSVTISGTTATVQSYIDGPGLGYLSGYLNGQLIGSSLDTSIYYNTLGYASARIARAKYPNAGTSSAELSVNSYNQLVVSEMTGCTSSAGCTYFDSSNILMLYVNQTSLNANYLAGLTANLITFV
jgi:hypothetical protein